jgi:hypothetical protein
MYLIDAMLSEIKIVGIFHWIFSILVAFYAFLFPKTMFDFIYLFGCIMLLLFWTMCNGECIITYWIKSYQDINYLAGMSTNHAEDMILIPETDDIVLLLLWLGQLVTCTSIYMVFLRNGFTKWLSIPFISTYFLYRTISRFSVDHHENHVFQHIQKVTQGLTVGYLGTYIYLLSQRQC